MAQNSGRMSICFLAAVASVALLLMTACGGGSVNSPQPPSGSTFSSLELSPATVTVLRGNSGTLTVTTTSEGSQNLVSLTVSGAPAGANVSFDPDTIPAPGSSTMTIAVGAGTHTGSYSVGVNGTAGGIQKTAQLKLNVSAQVFLQWNGSGSGNIVGYNVARSTTPGQGYSRINSTPIPDTFYSDQTVESGHTYYYLATAVDEFGNESAPSNEAMAEVE